MIYSYVLGGRTFSDPNYDPYPEKIYLHDNVFIGGGTVPRHEALIALHQETGNNTPNIVWDGLLREGASNDPVVCLANNGEESFVNLNGGDASVPPSFDTAMHQCSLPRLSEIKFDFPGG